MGHLSSVRSQGFSEPGTPALHGGGGGGGAGEVEDERDDVDKLVEGRSLDKVRWSEDGIGRGVFD